MTLQEIFTISATHLLKQRERSEHDTGMCAYRGQNGLMCAVGVLIPDSCYSPHLEGLPATDPEVMGALVSAGVIDSTTPCAQLSLLSELQVIHDNFGPETWESHLQDLANAYGLTMPEAV